jgi:hypothetical protein
MMNLRIFALLPAYLYLLIAFPVGSGRPHGGFARVAKYIDNALPGVTAKVLYCVAITFALMALNHWYYYRAYFKRIAKMQQSLDELSVIQQ